MVSLLNNGFRLFYGKNEPLSQHSCLVYDPYYCQPNLNRIDTQQNLLYPQDQPDKEQKKPKKSKKKTTNEKTVRENAPLVDYSKEDLIAWLKSLPLEERFEVFSIKNAWLAIAFVKMYQRWSESHNSHFALFLDDNNKISSEKNGLEFGDLENHFLYRHAGSENNAQMSQAEKEIIDSIRIYDNEELYEMIGFKEDTIQDIDKVIKLFGIISGETAFTRPCKVGNDPNTKSNAFDMPIWFNPNSFQTLAAWIVSNFEKAIWIKYIHNKKHPKQGSSSFDVFDFKLTVNYKKSLTDFWKGLEKSKKKKIVQVASDTLHSLSSDNAKPQPSEGKDINQALKLFYENPLYARARGSMSAEGLCAYFNHLFEEGNEISVIETILMTPLSQFGTIPNLICRKISHNLKNMLSEKIASDLILNEEREKKQNQKKKQNKKKKNKKPVQHDSDPVKTEEINLEIKFKDNSTAQKEESKMDSLWGDERGITCNLVGSDVPETEYVQIKDLESQQTFNMVRVRKAEENFINHLTEASTTNASESENDAKQNVNEVKQTVKNKKHLKKNKKSESKLAKEMLLHEESVQTLWEAQISNDEKEMLKDVSEVTKANEAEAAAAVIDDWSIFDFDKKVSKSQKKKQKKRAKKAEQEMQKDEQEGKREEDIELMVIENNTNNRKGASLTDLEEVKENKGLQRAKTFENGKIGTCTIENVEKMLEDNFSSVSQRGSNGTSRKSSEISINLTSDKSSLITSTNKQSSLKEDDISQSEVSCRSSGFGKDFWKEDVNTKTFPVSTATTDLDDGGFIEVKARKKPEKEKKPKGKREPKDSWKKKKEKEPAEKTEKKKTWKDNSRIKSPPKSAETKKTQSENRGNHTEKSGVATKNDKTEHVTLDASNKKTVIITTEVSKTGSNSGSKILAPKPVKKSVPVVPISGSSHSSESENAGSTTKSTGQISHTSHSTAHSSSHSAHNQASDHSDHGHKTHKCSHPLSISSPSLELETIKTAKAKELANEFFNKKFESDIYAHVAALTDEANKMTDFRILAYRRLEYCIASLFPSSNIKTKIFGSCATGLALKMSDVDIAVSGLPAYERYALCDYLLIISDTLAQFKWITKNQPILTATVPILKLEIDLNKEFGDTCEIQKGRRSWNISTDHKECLNVTSCAEKEDLKIRVDLSVESMGIVGYNLHVGYKTTDFVQKMLEKHDSLYIVTMVLKEFLHNRKLLNAYRGGISSYTLFVMIVALFQKFGDEGYMASLRRFFNYYGEIFKPESTGITLLERDPFFPLSHSYETAPLWVIVEHNSFDRKNIGQGAYSIKAILHEFEKASKTIQYCKQKLEEICIKHYSEVKCAEDILKIQDDEELKTLLNSNILELFIKDV